MSGARWSELPEHLQGRIAKDYIAPQKPRAAPAPAPAAEPTPKNALKRRNRAEESRISQQVRKWRDECIELQVHPELAWFHAVPNGSNRGKAAAGRAKGEGQVSGVHDWHLPVVRERKLTPMGCPVRGQGLVVEGGAQQFWNLFPGMMIELKLPAHRGKAEGGLSPNQVRYRDHLLEQGYKTATCYSCDEVVTLVMEYLNLRKPGETDEAYARRRR